MPAFTVLDTLELTDAYMNVRYIYSSTECVEGQ